MKIVVYDDKGKILDTWLLDRGFTVFEVKKMLADGLRLLCSAEVVS